MNVIMVGAGIAGLSTAWSLAKAGHSVTIVEQGTIPNPLAASGDHHRIIRRAYGRAGYGRLITEAYEAWDEMWADLGENHLDPRGFICISREAGDEAEEYSRGLEAADYPFETVRAGGRGHTLAVPGARHVPLRLFLAGRRCAALPQDRRRPRRMAAEKRRQRLRKQQGDGGRRRSRPRRA